MRRSLPVLYALAFLFSFAPAFELNAQGPAKSFSRKEMRRKPLWIDMMNDPNANYYETIRAFREFWKSRVLPKEAFEQGDDQFEREVGLISDNERERERMERSASPKKIEEGNHYAADVRAFKGWMQDSKPWLKADGTIMTMSERQAVLDRQQEELREQERKNQK